MCAALKTPAAIGSNKTYELSLSLANELTKVHSGLYYTWLNTRMFNEFLPSRKNTLKGFLSAFPVNGQFHSYPGSSATVLMQQNHQGKRKDHWLVIVPHMVEELESDVEKGASRESVMLKVATELFLEFRSSTSSAKAGLVIPTSKTENYDKNNGGESVASKQKEVLSL